MFYLLILLILFCCRTNALVTVLCNELLVCSGQPPLCTYVQVGCVLVDNGHVKISRANNYPISYHSGGFDGNGYHVEFYFGEDWTVSIGTPNGEVSRMGPAGDSVGHLYFAFNDQPLEQGASDARTACDQFTNFPTLTINCDEVYDEALKVYKPN